MERADRFYGDYLDPAYQDPYRPLCEALKQQAEGGAAARCRADALVLPTGPVPVEYCKLLEYRRDPATCWRPGLGLR